MFQVAGEGVSWIYLIRHGQAGLRHSYDSLSDLGREQAALAGGYLAQQQICFSAIYSGSLRRQVETAQIALEQYALAGVAAPAINEDRRWNEFDMEGVMAEIIPLLAADDPEFRRQHEELSRHVADDNSELHRRWTPCDTAAMAAWMQARYPVKAESWQAFRERIAGRLGWLKNGAPDGNLAIFTSAVPIALCVAGILDLSVPNMLKLAGAMHNSAINLLHVKGSEVSLVTYNATPHLSDPALRTHR